MKNTLLVIAITVVIAMILGMIIALPIWLLYNWIMASIFGLPELTFLQTYGLFVLLSLIFNTFLRFREVK
jgi:hypothetical protein